MLTLIGIMLCIFNRAFGSPPEGWLGGCKENQDGPWEARVDPVQELPLLNQFAQRLLHVFTVERAENLEF